MSLGSLLAGATPTPTAVVTGEGVHLIDHDGMDVTEHSRRCAPASFDPTHASASGQAALPGTLATQAEVVHNQGCRSSISLVITKSAWCAVPTDRQVAPFPGP
jgi:hypothetical protein